MGKKTNDKKRLQFDFSPEAIDRLDVLVEKTDSATRVQVVRNALRVYEYLVDKTKEGYDISFSKEDEKVSIAPLPI